MITALLLIFGTIVSFVLLTLFGCFIVKCIFDALERKDAKEAGEKFDRICDFYNRREEERMAQLKKLYKEK